MHGYGPSLLDVHLGAGVRGAFTRRGQGGSQGAWSGLNLGLNTGDDGARVRANREALGRAFGAPIVFATQVHGADVARVFEPAGDACGEFDAMTTSVAGLALGVLVADCVPILLGDGARGAIAVVHAGRAGLVAGVVPAAVEALVDRGARRESMRAAVGPSACGACYEVPRDMQADVAAAVANVSTTTRAGTPGLDIAAGVIHQLAASGVRGVSRVQVCTIEDDGYYSYRRAQRSGQPTGRFAGLVRLTGPATG